MNNVYVVSQFSTRLAFESIFGRAINLPGNVMVAQKSGPDTLSGKKDCRLCLQEGDKLRRKSRFSCSKCTKPVCQQHSKVNYTCLCCITENR